MKRRAFMVLAGILVLAVAGCGTAPGRSEGRSYPPPRLLPAREEYPSVGAAARAETREAAPVLDDKSTLRDYLAYAAINNPGLEAAFERWKAAMEVIPQVTSLPDPRFQYAYFIENVETRVGPQEHKLTLSQMFPWFGKLRLKGQMAARAAEARWAEYQAEKLNLFHRVKRAYAQYYFTGQSIEITRENLELLKYVEGVARETYRTGEGRHSDVVRAQVEIGKLEDRLEALREMRRPRAAELNAALGRPAGRPLSVPRRLPDEPVRLDEKTLVSRLAGANPRLKALVHSIEKEKVGVELAKKEYYPNFSLGVSYIETGSAVMPTDESGKDPVVAMLGLNIPIWRPKYAAAVREARARVRAAERSLSEKQYGLESRLQSALFGVEDARRKMRLYRHTLIPKAEESLKVTRAGFRTGEADFTDLLDAQRTLLDFQLTVERARADHLERVARVEKLVGEALPRREENP